jgi:hypothetical protein
MRRLPLATIAALVLGCGSSVEIASTTSGGGGAGGASTGTGATSTTITITTTSVTTLPPPACDPDSTFLEYQVDGGGLTRFDDTCAPSGFFVWPGGADPPGPPPPPNATLVVEACPVSDQNPVVVSGASPAWPGTSTNASLQFYSYPPAGPATLVLVVLADVGGYLEGSFSGTIMSPGGGPTAVEVSGKFRVCRQPDQIPV